MKITNDNYKEVLKGISVVEVSGESCANCLTLMPILDRLVGKREDATLHHIEAAPDTMMLIQKYEVESVPQILILYNDILEERVRGFQPEEILEIWLDKKIEDVKKKYKI